MLSSVLFAVLSRFHPRSPEVAMARFVVRAAVCLATAVPSLAAAQRERTTCDADNGGITLPDGFCALVVADSVGPARHITTAPNGDLFVAIRNLRDVKG